MEFKKEYLTVDIRKAANWFFWIGVLSIINSMILYLSGKFYFIVGLGITQLIDGIIYNLNNSYSPIGLIPNLIVAGIFIYIGYRARNYDKWAFVIGVTIYALDAIIYLIFREWMSVAFHIFALIMISRVFFKVFEYDKASKQKVK